MSELAIGIVVGAVVGLTAGGIYFGLLWWSVRRLVAEQRSPTWFLVGALARGAGALLAFWVAIQFGLAAIAAAMVAFFGARSLAIRMVGRPEAGAEREA